MVASFFYIWNNVKIFCLYKEDDDESDAAVGWRNLISLRLGYGCGVFERVVYGSTELLIQDHLLVIISLRLKYALTSVNTRTFGKSKKILCLCNM